LNWLSLVIFAVSALAIWNRSTAGYVVAGLANVAMVWLIWLGC
jgi:hypothetical protein